MPPETPEQRQLRLEKAIPICKKAGFFHVSGFLFQKNGIIYDLSIADLSQLMRIEDEGLFVVTPEEAKEGDPWTAGPWWPPHLSDSECACKCASICEETYAGGILTIHVDNGIKSVSDGGNDCPPLEEAKANGRLVSVAPDMIRLLEQVVNNGFCYESAKEILEISSYVRTGEPRRTF